MNEDARSDEGNRSVTIFADLASVVLLHDVEIRPSDLDAME